MTTAMRDTVRQVWDHVRAFGPVERQHPVRAAVRWLRANRLPGQGFVPHPRAGVAFQEVTGYTIPTLYRVGEKGLAQELARWEASVQRPDGAMTATDGVAYTFDTAQVARGFMAVLDDLPEIEPPLRRACDYVAGQIDAEGRVHTPSYDAWKFEDGTMFTEYGNLYLLPPLMEAGERLGEGHWVDAARRALDRYRRLPDLVEFKPSLGTLSHFFGYMMEALVDLGELDLARQGLQQAEAIQRADGAVPAYPGAGWVCSTGLAQLAVAWYKLGIPDPADRALSHLEGLQHRSGGFFGSYGDGARYFPDREISWAAKFFIDACSLRIARALERDADRCAPTLPDADGRVRALLGHLGDLGGRRVLDVGCGKGAYLRALQRRWPDARLHGVAPTRRMLSACPEGVATRPGTILDLHYPDASFDAAYTVETLERAPIVENAVKELVRVLSPGGRLVIVGKGGSPTDGSGIAPWERRYRPREVLRLLERYGVEPSYEVVPRDAAPTPGGSFIVWKGAKPC